MRKLGKRQEDRTLDSHIDEQFSGGRLYAAISSRPGQCGRADGYLILFTVNLLYLSNYVYLNKPFLRDVFNTLSGTYI